MTEKKLQFNKSGWLKKKKIERKTLIFLDNFVWNEMIKENNKDFIEIKERLSQLSKSGKIIVPIGISMISEIVNREDHQQVIKILKLIDDLSNGVFFLIYKTIFKNELKKQLLSKLNNKTPSRINEEEIFGPTWEMLGEITIKLKNLPPNLPSDEQINILFEKMASEIKLHNLSHAWFHSKGLYKNASGEYLEKRYKEEVPQVDFAQALKEEKGVYAKSLINEVKDIIIEIMPHVTDEVKLKEILGKHLTECIENCPTFECYVTMHAKLRSGKDLSKSIKVNDFFDIFHLTEAIPYCDIILCDKGMAHVLKQELKFDKKFKTEIMDSTQIQHFKKKLEEIENE